MLHIKAALVWFSTTLFSLAFTEARVIEGWLLRTTEIWWRSKSLFQPNAREVKNFAAYWFICRVDSLIRHTIDCGYKLAVDEELMRELQFHVVYLESYLKTTWNKRECNKQINKNTSHKIYKKRPDIFLALEFFLRKEHSCALGKEKAKNQIKKCPRNEKVFATLVTTK